MSNVLTAEDFDEEFYLTSLMTMSDEEKESWFYLDTPNPIRDVYVPFCFNKASSDNVLLRYKGRTYIRIIEANYYFYFYNRISAWSIVKSRSEHLTKRCYDIVNGVRIRTGLDDLTNFGYPGTFNYV